MLYLSGYDYPHSIRTSGRPKTHTQQQEGQVPSPALHELQQLPSLSVRSWSWQESWTYRHSCWATVKQCPLLTPLTPPMVPAAGSGSFSSEEDLAVNMCKLFTSLTLMLLLNQRSDLSHSPFAYRSSPSLPPFLPL
jgi:hypothetical protein